MNCITKDVTMERVRKEITVDREDLRELAVIKKINVCYLKQYIDILIISIL